MISIFTYVDLPLYQNEQKCHGLLVLISVLGVLELEPELLSSPFIDLAEHFLDDLLVPSELFGEQLIPHVVDRGSNCLSGARGGALLIWVLSLVLFIGRDGNESGVLLQVDSKLCVVVLDMVVIPERRQQTGCSRLSRRWM